MHSYSCISLKRKTKKIKKIWRVGLGEETEVPYDLIFFPLGAFHNYWNISKHNSVLQMWKKGTDSRG